ncbi:hypothetical protein SALBM217S_07552 [Streptomyces griseoloalbus]
MVTLVRPSAGPARPARTASGSVAVPGARARVARAGRIYVEGRHDAELVEKVWGDDLRVEGVVVEYLRGRGRPGPRPPPVGAPPVELVVQTTPRLRGRPVRHLVPGEPRPGQPFLGEQVPVGVDVVVRHRHLAPPDPAGQLRALLDDQRVRAHMVGTRADRRVERGAPVVVRLPRRAVDQVEVDVVEAGRAGLGDARLGPAGGVGAVEDLQHVLPGALHAEGDPVEAAGPQLGQVGRADGLRVGLRGDLGVRRETELLADRAQHPHQVARGEQGGRASADEHRAHRARVVAEDLPGQPDLVDEGLGVVVAGGEHAAGAAQLGRGVGVEVAVAAAGGAVGDVQVEPEGAVGRPGERGRGQRAVGGDGLAVGECGRHVLHCPAPGPCPSAPPEFPATARRLPPEAHRLPGSPSRLTPPGAPAGPCRPPGAVGRTRARAA